MQPSYGKHLKNSRKAAEKKLGKKMTQEYVAEYLNISTPTYQGWETSKYIADEYSLLELEKLFEDKGLAIRYMQEHSPVMKMYGEPLMAALAIKGIYAKLEPLIPHLSVFIDTMTQVAC